ncbi:cysteine hydrolase family protein [Sporolactobacillus laevolacticus]|nr:cysteine hydrolase family protein [Sporolactobacillus laevolacticus]
MNEALIIIDVQNDYFEGGRMPLNKPVVALEHIKKALNYFRKTNKTIVFVKHIAKNPGATFFLENTDGVKIHTALAAGSQEKEYIVQKNFPNSFLKTGLQEVLTNNKIDTLVICGMMTHMCVDSTTRQAAELGYHCTLLGDACATKDLTIENYTVEADQVQAAFLAALGAFGQVKTTDSFLTSMNDEK